MIGPVKTVPEIPKAKETLPTEHPDFGVYGRTGYKIGTLIYGFNLPFEDGYRFMIDNEAACWTITAETLEQIAAKIREANAAVKAGLL